MSVQRLNKSYKKKKYILKVFSYLSTGAPVEQHYQHEFGTLIVEVGDLNVAVKSIHHTRSHERVKWHVRNPTLQLSHQAKHKLVFVYPALQPDD